MKKTILISAFNPFVLRNILISGALPMLARHFQVVVLVPDYKKEYFQKEIGSEKIIIEGEASFVTASGFTHYQKITRQDTIFRFINSSLVPSRTLFLHKKEQLAKRGGLMRFWVSIILMRFIRLIPGIVQLFRFIDYSTMRKDYYSDLFGRYRPAAVFATDIFNDDDVHLMAEARRNRAKVIGMVRSWDNFTTKGVPRIQPDSLIVQSEVLKKEAHRFGRIPLSRIFVSGMPQYDRYISGQRMPREEFFKKIGLNPNRKLILYSPFGKRFSDIDGEIMDILKSFIRNQEIPDSDVLVRNTPNDSVFLGSFIPNDHFFMDDPGHFFNPGVYRDRELNRVDIDWLVDCLYHADVVVAAGASIGIDAAIFGKPNIIIHFDGYQTKPYVLSVRKCVEYDHPAPLIKSGAMRSAQSIDQLRSYLGDYLNNPKKDEEARRAMLRDYCWKLDGHAGDRIGQFIVGEVNKTK